MANKRQEAGERQALRSYGRRKGKRLSPRKERLVAELLPTLRPNLTQSVPADLRTLFPVPLREVWLEIGFGSGEHLVWQAEHHPDVGIIGCEPFLNGVAALLGAIEDRGLQTVLIHDGDARGVLSWLTDGAIGRAFILFPDPWPKKRQLKRRLVTEDTVRALARVLAPGGALLFASDNADYASQVLRAVHQSDVFDWCAAKAADWRDRPADWPETRYERKALSEGRKPVYLQWRRL
ncbi:MAG: tRNA (guanine(46)-N(7))-methyltransferase TrmB [Alphaproteobacteria bacterium]|jgi:tRNA (guanine-N7-)-methyltransferase